MTPSAQSEFYPICVIGGGLVGKMAALELAAKRSGHGTPENPNIALIAPVAEIEDSRTTAMLMPAIEMLRQLNLWEAIEPLTAALKTMRLIDGSQRLVRAPITDFHSTEIDLEAFGYNVPNADMLRALDQAIEDLDAIAWIKSRAEIEHIGSDFATLRLDDDTTITCELIVAADGRNSAGREAAGIRVSQWSYPQTAVVLNFTHTLPHNSVSAEFHTETGPFTQVPLPPSGNSQNRSSLVWMVRPDDADHLINMSNDVLSFLVEEKLQSCYGKCSVETKPVAIPMQGMTAQKFGDNRTVLVGESGHVFPPIGAQGFNLGMRDLRDLVSVLAAHTGDPGSTEVTNHYDRLRQVDVKARTAGVDAMNRSLLTNFLPVQVARAAGLSALGSITTARKIAMLQGIGMESRIRSIFTAPGKDLLARFRSQSDTATRSQ